MNRYFQFTVAFLLATSLLASSQKVQAASTIVVNPASPSMLQPGPSFILGGWGFSNEGTAGGSHAFVEGPDAHSGSLKLATSANTDGPYFAGLVNGFNIADLSTLQYDVYSASATGSMPTLQFDVDLDSTDGNISWQGRAVFIPSGPFTAGVWQTFDALSDTQGTWFTSGSPTCSLAASCSWTEFTTAFPNAVVYSSWSQSSVAGSGAVGFKKGSGESAPFTGYVDNLVIDSTTYDFEPLWDVYVDDNWSAVSSGADPDSTGPATNYNADSFDTVQEGLNAVANGGTVHVNAGTYTEDLTIGKSLTLLGPNSAINPNTGTRVAEAVLVPASSGVDPSGTCIVTLYIEKSDTTIKGFTVDGDNPANTSGVLVNGVDVDACEGVAGFEGMGNTVFENNIVKNTTYTGVDFYNYVNSTATAGNFIRYNKFENIGNPTFGFGIGVLIYNNFYADITDNVFNNVRVGIQTGNYSQANPGSTGSISNNTINAIRLGIFHNLWYSNASTIAISNNTINAVSSVDSNKWNGILISSFQGTVNTTISNNIINIGTITQDPSAGYNIWNTPTSATLTISGGTVTGGKYGVWVNNFEGYVSNAGNTSIKVDGVTINNASTAGIFVSDSPSNTNGSTVYANIQNSTISNSVTGILVSGSDATAKANLNKITGNATAGVTNTSGNSMDAEKNWWNHLTGPSGSGTGSGNAVSTNVDFTPWCGDAACSFFVPPYPLVVTANNHAKTVGEADPTFTFGYSGFVNGDTSAVIDTAPTCSVSGPHSTAGSYPIVCSGGSDDKYVFSYVNGTLTVNAANNPPTDIGLSNSSVDENAAVGTTVGTLSTTDADGSDTFTYELVNAGVSCPGTDNAAFQISGSLLQTNAIFDFETKSSYTICIQTNDGHAGTFEEPFTVIVNDLTETVTASFTSIGNQDGWILESGENTRQGGLLNFKQRTFQLGDDASDKQYKAILSFDTSALPDNAIITGVTIKIKRKGIVGTNPFLRASNNIKVDIHKGTFGTAALQLEDFRTNGPAGINKNSAGLILNTPDVGNWYSADLLTGSFSLVHTTGTTQIRLRFQKDDNNDNGADFIKFFSGNYFNAAYRPVLIIEYELP